MASNISRSRNCIGNILPGSEVFDTILTL